jgi:hypothetical protein
VGQARHPKTTHCVSRMTTEPMYAHHAQLARLAVLVMQLHVLIARPGVMLQILALPTAIVALLERRLRPLQPHQRTSVKFVQLARHLQMVLRRALSALLVPIVLQMVLTRAILAQLERLPIARRPLNAFCAPQAPLLRH